MGKGKAKVAKSVRKKEDSSSSKKKRSSAIDVLFSNQSKNSRKPKRKSPASTFIVIMNQSSPSYKSRGRRSRPPPQPRQPRPAFQLQLPPQNSPKKFNHAVPWKTNTTATRVDCSPGGGQAKKKSIRLPCDDVTGEKLRRLDAELEGLAEYMSLSRAESAERQHCIEQLQQIATREFGSKCQIQVFGSFATPEVCTWQSDVDVALWGVVEQEQELEQQSPPILRQAAPKRTTFEGEEQRQAQLDRTAKRQRIDKWLEALSENDDSDNEKKDKDESSKSGVPQKDPLFVIDLVGEDPVDINVKPKASSDPTENAISLDDASTSDTSTYSADKLQAWEQERRQEKPIVSLSSSESEAEDGQVDESNLAVSMVTHGKQNRAKPMGPTGLTRQCVVRSLGVLARRLRRLAWTDNVQVIKKARVPIVKLTTKSGLQTDIAVGGHNGSDTSHYAAEQVEKYQSFATVVLVLKALLAQQGLDEPFTGGLGSYKLYVLVTYHIQRHLQLGGSDRPGEVLLSFLFRYGHVKGHNVDHRARTLLWRDDALRDENGCTADLSNVFLLEHCVNFFKNCWSRLWKRVNKKNQADEKSLLMNVVDAPRLQRDRQECLRRATVGTNKKDTSLASKSEARNRKRKSDAAGSEAGRVPSEKTAEQLMAGYGVDQEGVEPLVQPSVKRARVR